jgi:hypothetical protein
MLHIKTYILCGLYVHWEVNGLSQGHCYCSAGIGVFSPSIVHWPPPGDSILLHTPAKICKTEHINMCCIIRIIFVKRNGEICVMKPGRIRFLAAHGEKCIFFFSKYVEKNIENTPQNVTCTIRLENFSRHIDLDINMYMYMFDRKVSQLFS